MSSMCCDLCHLSTVWKISLFIQGRKIWEQAMLTWIIVQIMANLLLVLVPINTERKSYKINFKAHKTKHPLMGQKKLLCKHHRSDGMLSFYRSPLYFVFTEFDIKWDHLSGVIQFIFTWKIFYIPMRCDSNINKSWDEPEWPDSLLYNLAKWNL